MASRSVFVIIQVGLNKTAMNFVEICQIKRRDPAWFRALLQAGLNPSAGIRGLRRFQREQGEIESFRPILNKEQIKPPTVPESQLVAEKRQQFLRTVVEMGGGCFALHVINPAIPDRDDSRYEISTGADGVEYWKLRA